VSEIRESLVQLLDTQQKDLSIVKSSLITEDGLVIVNNSENEENNEITQNFAAISASILSMAERGIEIINANKILEQIKIDAGFNENSDADFTVMITRVYSNVLLLLIFPKTTNMGLIHYETSKIIKKIRDLVMKDTSKAFFSDLGSLT